LLLLRSRNSNYSCLVLKYFLINKGNVAYEGEFVKIEVTANNKYGKKDINTFMVELVEYVFVCANNGVSRTYSKVISSNKIIEHVKVQDKKTF